MPIATLSLTPPLTPTASPTSNPTSKPTPTDLITDCLEIRPALPKDSALEGRVILIRPSGIQYMERANIWLDLATGITTPVETPERAGFSGYSVSPDGRRIAYWKKIYDNDGKISQISIIISRVDGQIETEISKEPDQISQLNWLDNQRIIWAPGKQSVVINITTGAEELSLSNWYSQSPGGLADSMTNIWDMNVIPNKALDRLLYQQYPSSLILLDIQGGQVLADIQIPSKGISIDTPKWLKDDSEIVFSKTVTNSDARSPQDFFGLDRNGELGQLTHLSDYFPDIAINNFSLSPQGGYLAFYFSLASSGFEEQFAVLDLNTRKVTNYCNLSGSTRIAQEPIWSPDGEMLLIERREMDKETWKTVLVDISRNLAFQVWDGLIPAGWMVAP